MHDHDHAVPIAAAIGAGLPVTEPCALLPAPLGATVHPPDELGPEACAAGASGGEATNAWVAPNAVVPAPAT